MTLGRQAYTIHNQWNIVEDSQNLLHVTTYMLPLHNVANIAKEMPNRFPPPYVRKQS